MNNAHATEREVFGLSKGLGLALMVGIGSISCLGRNETNGWMLGLFAYLFDFPLPLSPSSIISEWTDRGMEGWMAFTLDGKGG